MPKTDAQRQKESRDRKTAAGWKWLNVPAELYDSFKMKIEEYKNSLKTKDTNDTK